MQKWMTAVLVMLLTATAGCATMQNGEDDIDSQPISLTVENDLLPPATVSIYANPRTGGRVSLGLAPSGTTTQFLIERSNSAEFRFVAQTASGEELQSDEITLGPGDRTIWDLSNNILVPDQLPDPN